MKMKIKKVPLKKKQNPSIKKYHSQLRKYLTVWVERTGTSLAKIKKESYI